MDITNPVKFDFKGREVALFIHEGTKIRNGIEGPFDSVSNRIYQKKMFYDIEKLNETLDYITSDSVVVDCGANLGNHTVFWSQHCKKVYAFEPFELNYRLLKKNIETNNCNAESYKILLGKEDSTRYRCESNEISRAATRFIKDEKGDFVSDRLDNIITVPVDFMKIDVEGAELDLLHGAAKIIQSFHPILYIEVHFFDCNDMDDKVINLLSAFDYQEGKDLFLYRRKKPSVKAKPSFVKRVMKKMYQTMTGK
jgi:FkbM family methyltransferase